MFADAPVTMPQEVRVSRSGRRLRTFSIQAWKYNAPGGEAMIAALVHPKKDGEEE